MIKGATSFRIHRFRRAAEAMLGRPLGPHEMPMVVDDGVEEKIIEPAVTRHNMDSVADKLGFAVVAFGGYVTAEPAHAN